MSSHDAARRVWIGLLVCSLAAFSPAAPPVSAGPTTEDEDADAIAGRQDPYDPIIDLRKVEYIPESAAKSKKRTLRFTFNVAPDVPKDAKINFELEYKALPFESTNFVLEGQNRRGLVLEWSPKKELAIDEYFLRVRMFLNDQTPAVRKAIEQKPAKFPKEFEPWPWLYFDTPVKVGTEAELLEQKNAICDLYGKYMDRLVANYSEFQEAMDKVAAGEAAVNGTSLDQAKFEKIVVDWREKQGKLQEEIQNLVIDNPVVAATSETAYRYLSDLGCMVSKAGHQRQKAVTDKYGVAEIRPKKVNPFFNPSYRYAAGKEALNKQLERIETIVCAHLLEETEGDAAAQDGSKAGAKKDGEKDGAKKDGAKEDGAKEDGAKEDGAKDDAKEPSSKRKPTSSKK